MRDDIDFVLSLDRRDEILRAAKAIERQLKNLAEKPADHANIWVIGTNLSVIQMCLTNLPQAS
jgi:hypothetical protein